MAKEDPRRGKKKPKPRLWRYNPIYAALRDITDQLIAQRGGDRFVPRPEIPGHAERWRRKDAALQATLDKFLGK